MKKKAIYSIDNTEILWDGCIIAKCISQKGRVRFIRSDDFYPEKPFEEGDLIHIYKDHVEFLSSETRRARKESVELQNKLFKRNSN